MLLYGISSSKEKPPSRSQGYKPVVKKGRAILSSERRSNMRVVVGVGTME
jgi:hypothetical protein